MKHILFAALLCSSAYGFAQKTDMLYVPVPQKTLPDSTRYGNYQSFDLYCYVSATADTKLNGRYTTNIYGLTQDPNHGDFKILADFSKMGVTRWELIRDTGWLQMNWVATFTVYDKEGHKVMTSYEMNLQSGSIRPGVKRMEDLTLMRDDMTRDAIAGALPDLLYSFQAKYIGVINRSKGFMWGKIFTWRENKDGQAFNDHVLAISKATDNPANFRATLEQQLPFWQQSSTITGIEKDDLFRTIAYHNLALIYLYLGNRDSANACAARVEASEATNSYLKKQLKKSIDTYKDAPTLSNGIAYVHPTSLMSHFSLDNALEDHLFYVINGQAQLNNGSTASGKILIVRKSFNGSQGNIASLDRQDFNVNILQPGGSIRKCKLSDIKSIQSGDTVNYKVQKEGAAALGASYAIFRTVYKNPRINVYRAVFPQENALNYYLKPSDTELQKEPFFGPGKWLKKYFGDCPDLVGKIDSKEIKDGLAMSQFYAESCK